MSEFVKAETRTSAKDRNCLWCPELIAKGEKYKSVTYRDAGRIFAEGFHPECADAWLSCDSDEWPAYGYKRGTLEEI